MNKLRVINRKIVNYIYDTTIDNDEWALKYKNKNGPTLAEGDYTGLGRQIVMSTKKTLGKNLKMTIKNINQLIIINPPDL